MSSDAPRFLRYVNPLQGTNSHHGFSTGNTLPLVALPFGMNHWSPQTVEGRWFFDPRSRTMQGIRCTHQPSPWMADYGHFVVMAQGGRPMLDARSRSTAYRLDQATVKPHHFRAEFVRDGTVLEVTPTVRGAVFRFTFPQGVPARVVFQGCAGENAFELRGNRLYGHTTGSSGGVWDGFAHYFVAELDWGIVSTTEFERGIALELGTADVVTMRIATSFISLEQAELNLRQEIGTATFDEILAQAESVWEDTLGQIEVEDEDEGRLRTFYSCLYRTQLFPRVWHEVDASGETIHRSPYDGNVHPGVLYTDNGFWDTYRTEYPLLALLMPERVGEIMQGWVNALKEGGWFPQWATPGYRACMVGTHIDAVMADAVARGVREFDLKAALAGMLKHAYEPGDPSGAYGRIGIEDYLRLGYVSTESHESVARSLDYAYDDWCIAQVATALGQGEEAAKLLERATNYRHLYHEDVGFMRGRNADGSWEEPWDEFKWGSPYVEGGPWQSSWAVQHDPAGLIRLMGGDESFAAKLDQMLTTAPRFEVGVYGFEIHEMTEMAAADFGQYAHSNQPVHHVLYLYAAAGRPWRTQREVRRVMDALYTPDDLPGDEDNGEMSAWYVLSALGLFPLCPGHPTWVLGSPLFRRATVRLPNGRSLVVEAPENSSEAVYVRRVLLNGQPVDRLDVSHEAIVEGGTLTFEMSTEPETTVVPADRRPYSMSPYSNS